MKLISMRQIHFVVNVRHIPGGRTSDYVIIVTDSFSSAADIFVKVYPEMYKGRPSTPGVQEDLIYRD